ncbi:MAG: MFS transporter [Clostridia bacterium]|nr:MFS transporter [Clostridia bacterium]
MKKLESYTHTIYASYLGYITQAIVNNLAPLLFLTFSREFNLTIESITMITTINFAVQLLVDLLSTKVVDKIGYRPCIVAAHVFSAAGLIGMAVLPSLTSDPYTGLLLAVVLYAIGGGIIEVLISPIVEACPTEKKEAAMSLLHSFYCWGHVSVVLISTLFFALFGVGSWRTLAVLFAVVPLLNTVYFLRVPIYEIVSQEEKMPLSGLLHQKVFWLLMVIMVCAGASEQAMSQWSSAFAESALSVSKTVGDLAGPCAFAVLMGTARAMYGKYSDKIPLKGMMMGSACLCIACYLTAVLAKSPVMGLIGCAVCGFSVGIFWPGTFSMAAIHLPAGGTAMYALMALAGDVGCSGGPTLVGMIAGSSGGSLKAGLIWAIVFPAVILLGISRLKKSKAGIENRE